MTTRVNDLQPGNNRPDALSKLLIEKGLITEAEFMRKLSAERTGYQAMLEKMR